MERIRVTIVPHTHWDREWYEPFEGFLQRLVEMMDTLIDLLDDGFPHFHLDGQTALIDDYLAVRPEREAEVRRLAAEGRISVGPWFTQMDEFLTSGESHIRNLERGLARNRDLGAQPVVGYLPDQFGHIGQMPQILANGGLDRAVVWRGVPRAVERTAFWWESPDGTRVLTEYLAFGYSIGMNLRSAERPRELAGMLRESVGNLSGMTARANAMLVMAGSDHHGPDPTLPERLRAMEPIAPELHTEIGPVAAFVEGPPPDDIPVWRGELRSGARAFLLPNVVSSRIHQKRERGRVEALVERVAEPLAALVDGFEWPDRELDRIWQLLLWNGAHDSVCGCSVDEVGRAVDSRHAEARELAEGITRRALETLGRQVRDPGTLRWNPSPFERGGVPGLGWRVDPDSDPAEASAREEPVAVELRHGRVVSDGLEIALFDEADVGDLYNFCPDEGASPLPPEDVAVEAQTATASFDGCTVAFRASRRAGEPFVRLEGAIDNARPDHRLRLIVTLPGPVDGAVAGAPFELVERGLTSEGGFEPDSPCWPARGVVLAGGVAVLHEGVMEYEVVEGRALAVTLLRCTGTISRGGFATRNWPAGPDIPTPEAQMLGRTEFALGLMSGAGRDDLLDAWERFALPLVEAPAAGGGELPSSDTLLDLRPGGARLSNVRRVGGAIEVRVWNPSPSAITAVVGRREIALAPARIETVPRVLLTPSARR
jgi:alpha-mannosidase